MEGGRGGEGRGGKGRGGKALLPYKNCMEMIILAVTVLYQPSL